MGSKQQIRLFAIQGVFGLASFILVFLSLFVVLPSYVDHEYDNFSEFIPIFGGYWFESLGTVAISIAAPMALTLLLFYTIKKFSNLQKPLRERKNLFAQYRRESFFALIWLMFVVTTGLALGAIVLFGFDQLYYDIEEYGWPYLILSTIGLFIAFDTVFYWFHRLLHWGPFYKYFHAVHHLTRTPHWMSQFNTSPLEHLYQLVIYAFILLFIPIHPGALLLLGLGASVKSFVGHLGCEVYPKNTISSPYLQWSTTVTHHEQHHAFGPYNFSFFFTWWDRAMGTEHPDYLEEFKKAKNNFTDEKADLYI